MTISVFGLGYVGLVNIACLSKKGYRLKGCDIQSGKVRQLQTGESPIFEPGLQEIIAENVENGNISAYHTAEDAIANAETAIICVGTPSMEDGTVELGYIKNTLMEIAMLANKSSSLKHVIVRSTIPPGTMKNIAAPLFQNTAELQLFFVPEFLREGSAIEDFFNSARTVIGTSDGQEAPQSIKDLFDNPTSGPVFCVDFNTAEFIKYVDNAWHAMKVAFTNEAYSIGSTYGVDIPQANKIFLEDKHLNICEKYLKPGLPFGGSCLPKDVRAINSLANNNSVASPLMRAMLESNAEHKKRLTEYVFKECGDNIILQGLTFKSNTDDLRESPLVDLAREIIQDGRNLTIIDPHVNLESLRTQFPDLAPFLAPTMKEFPNPAERVSIVVTKQCSLPGVINPERTVDLTFNGMKDQSDALRWVMG